MTDEVGPSYEKDPADGAGKLAWSKTKGALKASSQLKKDNSTQKKVTNPSIVKAVDKFMGAKPPPSSSVQKVMPSDGTPSGKHYSYQEVEEMARQYLLEKSEARRMYNRMFGLIFVCVFVVGSATLMSYFAMDSLKQFKVQGGDSSVEQPHAVLVAVDGNSILKTHDATIDIEGSVLLQREGGEFIVSDEDLKGVTSVSYMTNQTLEDDGHWYGTYASHFVKGLMRSQTSVSFITARGHEIQLVEEEDDGTQWEVRYLDHVNPASYLAEEEDEDDGRGRLLVTIKRETLDDTFVKAYAVDYKNYF